VHKFVDALERAASSPPTCVPRCSSLPLHNVPIGKPHFDACDWHDLRRRSPTSRPMRQRHRGFQIADSSRLRQTEASALYPSCRRTITAARGPVDPELDASAGRAVGGTEIRIMDPDGRFLPRDELAEIVGAARRSCRVTGTCGGEQQRRSPKDAATGKPALSMRRAVSVITDSLRRT